MGLEIVNGIDGDPGKKSPKTIHIFLGFFFIVNFCLGIGALGIPYAFFYSGLLAAIPTLLVISVVSWINANYLLEVMARAQALDYIGYPSKKHKSDDHKSDDQGLLLVKDPSQHPKFEITIKRKFEISELCDIFFNKYVKYVYLAILSMHGFMASWSYAAVAGSAWAINIPFRHFGATAPCEDDAFQHRFVPVGGCLYSYYFCLFMFAVVVVTLSMLDLKEQAYFQMILGLMRFLTIAAIVIYCIIRLIQGGSPCDDVAQSPQYYNVSVATVKEVDVDLRSVVLKFDPRGWVVAVPVFTFSFLFHTGIASLTHPVKQKDKLHYVVGAMFISSLICYLSLGVTVSLWFRSSIQETCTLNWAVFIRSSSANLALKIFSYYLILFPSFDVISAYPLITHTVVNNFYILITGHDTSESDESSKDASKDKRMKINCKLCLQLFLRFVVALVPIMAAFGMANLIYVLKYTGLVGFMCFLFPFSLQVRSIFVCQKEFSKLKAGKSDDGLELNEKEQETKVDSIDGKGDATKDPPELKTKSSWTFSKHMCEGMEHYMTPYSRSLISRPISVVLVGVAGSVLFVLAFSSLFLHPQKLDCDV